MMEHLMSVELPNSENTESKRNMFHSVNHSSWWSEDGSHWVLNFVPFGDPFEQLPRCSLELLSS